MLFRSQIHPFLLFGLIHVDFFQDPDLLQHTEFYDSSVIYVYIDDASYTKLSRALCR